MRAGGLDPSRAAESTSPSRTGSPGLASACLGAVVAIVIALWVGRPRFVLVAMGLTGGSVGALLSVAVGSVEQPVDRDTSASNAPWFHRAAAAGALGIAAATVLCWGILLEATIPGYGAATSAGLLSYAFLASVLPRW